MKADEPRKPRPGPSVYDSREPSTRQEGRVIAETDRDGNLRWREDWAQQASGWTPLVGGRLRR